MSNMAATLRVGCRDFRALVKLERFQLKNRLISTFRKSPLTFIGLFLVGAGFLSGYLKLSHMLVGFIYHQEVYGVLLASRLVQILLYIALGMALMSSLTTAIAHLYLSKDLEFQFSLPVNFNAWILHRVMQVFFQSSWMLLLFGGPLIWLYLYFSDANLLAQLWGLLVFATVCSFPVLFSVILCIVLVRIFPAKRVHQVFLVLTVVLVSSLILIFRYMEPEKFIGPGGLENFRGFVDMVNFEQQPWNPAMWAYNVIAALGQNQITVALEQFGRLLLLFFVALGGLLITAHKFYKTSWDRALQSLSGEAEHHLRVKPSFLSSLLSHPRWSQEARELLLFFRDPSQWSQIFVLFALLGLYLLSLTKLPSNPFGGTRYALALGNSAFVSFISLSIASRFVFTSFSADGEAIWLMKTAPQGWARFVRGKLVVFGFPILIFSELLSLLSGVILQLEPYQLALLGLNCFWDSSFMVLLALALGMLFINPGIDNPLKLIVSPGGLLLMFCGLFVSGIHAGLRLCEQSSLANRLFMNIGWPDVQDGRALWYYMGLIVVESMLLTYLIRRGLRHLRLGDFSGG